MNVQMQIDSYIADQLQPKREELLELHQLILNISPECKLWFFDGRNNEGKIVSNPNIGYGTKPIKYTSGKTKDFYRIGLSANTTGISVYVMGVEDKKHLSDTYGARLGKASITGYCIKFRSLRGINVDVLKEIVRCYMG